MSAAGGDGDGDRIGMVDSEGEILWADQHLLFLAEDLLTRRPGATVVGDVKSSRVLFEGVATVRGRPRRASSSRISRVIWWPSSLGMCTSVSTSA